MDDKNNFKKKLLKVIERSLNKLSQDPESLKDSQKDDKEIVLRAVKNNGESLYDVSDRLMDHEEIILVAVKKDGYYFKFAPQKDSKMTKKLL